MKIFETAVITAIAFSAACIAGAANAGGCDASYHSHSPGQVAEKYFAQMDTNADELVSKEEFKKSPFKAYVRNFEALRPNAEGFVEKEIFVKMFVDAHTAPSEET